MRHTHEHRAKTPRASRALVIALLCAASAAAQQKTDATFAFTADTHITYNGTDDRYGLVDIATDSTNPSITLYLALMENETLFSLAAPGSAYNGCTVGGTLGSPRYKSLCNQIQLVRKLNALTSSYCTGGGTIYRNAWPSTTWSQNGKTRRFAGAGQPFTGLKGLIIGGDLTDCAGGSVGDCTPKYDGTRHAQTYAFQALFDRNETTSYRSQIASASILRGLTNISADLPLKYALYPGLGNHDLDNFDINDGSSKLVSYVKSWSPDATGDRKVTNRDDDTGSYSMDWGNLHIIVVGVAPGLDAHTYHFSTDSLDWFKKDLATYAWDGRPVVIAQHFGFDTAWSLNDEFWFGDSRFASFTNLWPTIKDYNVIGFFTGHNHSAAQPYTFPAFGDAPNALGYDVFRPGAGYSQQFAAIHVTDHNMDVVYTAYADYDSSGIVPLNDSGVGRFTKKLVPGPKPTGDVPQLVDLNRPNVAAAAFSAFSGNRYLMTLDSRNAYKVRRLDAKGFPGAAVQTGNLTGTNLTLRSYLDRPNNETRILATSEEGMKGFRMSEPNGTASTTKLEMQLMWENTTIRGDRVMPFETLNSFFYEDDGKRNTFLLAEDYTGPTATLYRLGKQGPQFAGIYRFDSKYSYTRDYPFTYTNAAGRRCSGFIRYGWGAHLASAGDTNVEFYGIDDSDINNLRFVLLGKERWQWEATPIPLRMSDGSYQFLVKTPLSEAGSPNYTSSPYTVRAVLDNGTGSDLAWRGRVGLPMQLAGIIDLGVGSDGRTQIAALDNVGTYARYYLEP